MEILRLLVVADDPFARAGLAALLSDLPDCQVVGQLHSLELAETGELDWNGYAAHVIVWDFGWAGGSKLPDWQDITLPVVVLLMDESHTADLWANGVRAMLRRDVNGEKLETAVRAAAHRFIVLDPNLVTTFTPILQTADETPLEELTPREREVLQRLAEGLTNKAIALQLNISEHTVKFHVNALMNKLGAQSRTEAVVRATRQGLISL